MSTLLIDRGFSIENTMWFYYPTVVVIVQKAHKRKQISHNIVQLITVQLVH